MTEDKAAAARQKEEARRGTKPSDAFQMGLSDAAPDAASRSEWEHAQSLYLSDRYVVPPMSVLNTREGTWQTRRKQWLDMGIESELGRGDKLLGFSSLTTAGKYGKGTLKNTSVFDPVLCELVYRWFSPTDGMVLDPFAGGSVRGVVAARLGRRYVGIDLSEKQVEANRLQADRMGTFAAGWAEPRWVVGDSAEVLPKMADGAKFDMVFSCPPYYDLEQYSDDPRDLSNLDTYNGFVGQYLAIIKGAVDRLRDDAFACFVVANIRDKNGLYHPLVSDTISAFEVAGAGFYNDVILINSVGSAGIRTDRQFPATRKVGKVHQNVLVFCKGDPKKAADRCGPVAAAFNWTGGGDDG